MDMKLMFRISVSYTHLGTENVLTAAIESGVKRVVCLSTDKADVYKRQLLGYSPNMYCRLKGKSE